MKTPRALSVGCAVIALLTLGGIFAPWLSPFPPNSFHLELHHQTPSWAHPLGFDEDGCDVLAQVLFGARVSLLVGISVVSVSVALGMVVGTLSGYFAGWCDQIFMRVVDLLHAFPGFLLALALVAIMGPSIEHLIYAMCLTGWTSYARLVRGEVLHLKNREHVLGAIAAGATHWRVMVRHLWPNLFGQVIIQATFGFAGAILTESGLSFLGLGAAGDTPSWGNLLSSGRRSLMEAPHISLFAGLAILTAVLGFNLIGSGLREVLDPRLARD